MTIVPRNSNLILGSPEPAAVAVGDLTVAPEQSGPDPRDTIGAAFRQSNTIGSVLSNVDTSGADLYRIDPTFDPFAENKKAGLSDLDERFTDIFNPTAYQARLAEVQKEERDRKTLAAAGIFGDLMSLGAGIIDLPSLVPGGAAVRGARLGETITRSALSVGASAALGASVSEAALQGSQQMRTPQESAFAIGGSAILGSLLGAGVGAWMGKDARIANAAAIDTHLNTVHPDVQGENEAAVAALFDNANSAGAAAVKPQTLDDLSIAGKAAGAVGKASAWARMNPLVRLLDSPSVKVRETAEGLMENPLYLKKNFEGQASDAAVETLVKEYSQGAVANAMERMDAIYAAARKDGLKMSRDDFRGEIGKAMRRNDTSDIPGVTEAAQHWRKSVFDPLKERAIEAGLLPKDVEVSTADSYFSRLWNFRKIEANEAVFKQRIGGWIERQVPEDAEGFVNSADRKAYVDGIVDDIYNTLTGRIEGDLPRDIVAAKRGPLKDRTFNIPDNMVEGFIESDVEHVGRRYARIMAAEVEMTKKFGSPDMKDQLRSVQEDFAKERAKIELANPGDKEKQLVALNARERRDMDDIRAIRDILRGTYGARQNTGLGARALAVANTFNYLRTMGGVVASSLTDVARPLFVHGLSRFMGDGIKPLFTNLKAVKMSVREARLAGTVAEKVLNTRLATWAEITDPYAVSSPFERFMENTAKRFSQANGMVYWNDFMKSFAATMTQNRIIGGVTDFANAKPTEKAYLAFLGIDENMAERIARQFYAVGRTEDGIHVAGTEQWTDEVARRTYRAALNKDVDSIIVSKGVGDVPLFSRTPIGRALLQFKSFSLASHQRAFMRGLQGAELGVDGGRSGTLAAMISTTSIGMFIYWLKAVETNRVEGLDVNPGKILAEGLDRGGMLAVPFEINNTIEKAFGIGAYSGLQSLFPGYKKAGAASRYQSRGIAASIVGPSGAMLDTVIRASTALNDGKVSEGDVNAFFNLVPFLTLPGIRSVVDYQVKPRVKESVVTK